MVSIIRWVLCKFGFHKKTYKYDMTNTQWEHLGWYCRNCGKKLG